MTRRSLFHLLVIAPLAAILGKTKTDRLAAEIADAPSGFKLALARFRADHGVAVQHYAPGAIRIDARGLTRDEIWEHLRRDAARRTAR